MRHSFGPFVLDNQDVLRCGREVVVLGRRAKALLLALAEAAGAPVSKQELMARAWPGMIVADVNLSVQIASLRKALRRVAKDADWIVSVPRYGYQLRVDRETQYPRPTLPMLAVLAFHNLTGDIRWQYLADGFVEELISALSRFRGFAVFSRHANAVAHPQMGTTISTGADYVLEGSLQAAESELRVVVTLADTVGRCVWSESFHGNLADHFDFQDRVVRQVAAIVEPRLQATELERSYLNRPVSFDAYDLFLRGRGKVHEFEEKANAEAIALLERAVQIEPENGAYLGLACWALEMRITMGWPISGDRERLRCLVLAKDAVTRSPRDAAVLARCGIALQLIGHEYERGLAIAERAVALNPNDPIALLNAGLAHYLGGSLEIALERLNYCIALQPNDAYEAMGVISNVFAALGRHEEALTWASRGLAINANYQPCHWVVIASNAHLGWLDRAQAAAANLLAISPALTIQKLLRSHPQDPMREATLISGMRLAGLEEN